MKRGFKMRRHFNIPEDRLIHFCMGWLIALCYCLIMSLAGRHFEADDFLIKSICISSSIFIVYIIGSVWEVWQEKTNSGVKDNKDAIDTFYGGVAGSVFWLVTL